MNWFETIRKYYEKKDRNGNRMWTEEMVHNAVLKGKITEEEYREIVGK